MKSRKIRELIGKKVRQLREINKVTQMELAYELGYNSTGTISQVEGGTKGMDIERLFKTAQFFNVSLFYLLTPMEISKEQLRIIEKLETILKKPGTEDYNILRNFTEKGDVDGMKQQDVSAILEQNSNLLHMLQRRDDEIREALQSKNEEIEALRKELTMLKTKQPVKATAGALEESESPLRKRKSA